MKRYFSHLKQETKYFTLLIYDITLNCAYTTLMQTQCKLHYKAELLVWNLLNVHYIHCPHILSSTRSLDVGSCSVSDERWNIYCKKYTKFGFYIIPKVCCITFKALLHNKNQKRTYNLSNGFKNTMTQQTNYVCIGLLFKINFQRICVNFVG